MDKKLANMATSSNAWPFQEALRILKSINGKFNYIVDEDGNLAVGRQRDALGGGHIDLASARPVQAAGEFRVVGGELKYIDNSSGHYLPSGEFAQEAAESAFKKLGFDVESKYVEKQWMNDLSLKSGGTWRMMQ